MTGRTDEETLVLAAELRRHLPQLRTISGENFSITTGTP